MPWISRTAAMEHTCPSCGARIGEACRGAKRARRSVHAERIRVAVDEEPTLANLRIEIDHEGNILDEEGEIVGRLAGAKLDIQTAREGGVGGTYGGGRGRREENVNVKGNTGEIKKDNTNIGEVQKNLKPLFDQIEEATVVDPIKQVWDYYQSTIENAQRRKLDNKRRTVIKRALGVRTVEECKQAITGLSRSPHHNGKNDTGTKYLEIRYALGLPSESPDERIDKMSALVANVPEGQQRMEQLLAPFPSAERERIAGYMNDVRRACYPNATELDKRQGHAAAAILRQSANIRLHSYDTATTLATFERFA